MLAATRGIFSTGTGTILIMYSKFLLLNYGPYLNEKSVFLTLLFEVCSSCLLCLVFLTTYNW
jgi:hypothetical protein